jgi:hypothetical protein
MSSGKNLLRLGAAFCTLLVGVPAFGSFVITPTFTSNFVTDFGANAAAAEAAWTAAANVFEANFTDNIHVNITVDAVAGTGVFGQSNTFLDSLSYSTLRTLMLADAKTADDATATGAGGSITAADPVSGTHTWWVTTAQAKAIGLIPNNSSTDGTTTFGAGNPFTFAGPVAGGTYDFQGVAAHEISEVLGRLGLGGATVGGFANSYSLIDLFSFSGAGTRVLGNGGVGGEGSFSVDDGTTLLKTYNDQASNGLDLRDWFGGTNDSFNQISSSGVTNAVSVVDLREMDVIGYDRAFTAVPEPSSVFLLAIGLAAFAWLKKSSASLKRPSDHAK